MSILIKDMEKPEHCINCRFMVSRENDDCILQSDADNANFQSWDDMRKGCPLVTVPPHGRLIDADALDASLGIDDRDDWVHWTLESAPTIIPASEEGE